ncbi:MAG: protein translocase subunit SecF [Acidobacteriota bacterium]|jgi:preprotein translocase subunit SecF
MEILKNPNFNFLGTARYVVFLSVILVAGGVYAVVSGQVRYGVEFSEGTQLILQFQTTPEVDRIRDAVAAVSPGAEIQTFGNLADNKVRVRLGPQDREAGGGDTDPESDLDAAARAALAALANDYADNAVIESSAEIVGPTVGAELREKAILLVSLGLIAQLIYIGVRFKGGVWGAGAALAALHDVVVAIGVLTFFGYEITLNVIAALLTLVGYSVNDTIVIFDRARENLRQRRKVPMAELLNNSINQTLTRTVITSGTTFLALMGLYVFGGEVLRGFSFTLVVGTIVGTYSTMFVAIPLVGWWYARRSKPATPAAKAAL